MLPKRNRVGTKTVEEIFKKGVLINTPSLAFRFLQTKLTTPQRISVLVPKSVVKGAVKRNSLRRYGYFALASKINKFPEGILGVLIFRKPEIAPTDLEKELEIILNKT